MQTGEKPAGKVAVVTGGRRGLGRSAALAFASEGVSVAIVSRTESELREVAHLIGKWEVYCGIWGCCTGRYVTHKSPS